LLFAADGFPAFGLRCVILSGAQRSRRIRFLYEQNGFLDALRLLGMTMWLPICKILPKRKF